MKISGSLLILMLIFLNCDSQMLVGQSVFLQKMVSKDALLANGFKKYFRHIKSHSDPGSKTIIEEDLLKKKLYDTTLTYLFNDGQLVNYTISFSVKKTDTSSIFDLLTSLGFVREPGERLVTSIFINAENNIRFKYLVYPRYFRFVIWYDEN